MITSEKQTELEEVLRHFEQSAELPERFRLEPGAFLHLVKEMWCGQVRRDGWRRLSESKIADFMETKMGQPFTRSQFQTMFGEGRMIRGRYGAPWRQSIPIIVAKSYLEVVFENWSLDKKGSTVRLVLSPPIEMEKVIQNAVSAVYESGERVYCRNVSEPGVLRRKADISQLLEKLVTSGIRPLSLEDLEFLMRDYPTCGEDMSPELLKGLFVYYRKTGKKL